MLTYVIWANEIRYTVRRDDIDSCHGFGLLMVKDMASQFTSFNAILFFLFFLAFNSNINLFFDSIIVAVLYSGVIGKSRRREYSRGQNWSTSFNLQLWLTLPKIIRFFLMWLSKLIFSVYTVRRVFLNFHFHHTHIGEGGVLPIPPNGLSYCEVSSWLKNVLTCGPLSRARPMGLTPNRISQIPNKIWRKLMESLCAIFFSIYNFSQLNAILLGWIISKF